MSPNLLYPRLIADGDLGTTNSRRGLALGDEGACPASVEPVSDRPPPAVEASCQDCCEMRCGETGRYLAHQQQCA